MNRSKVIVVFVCLLLGRSIAGQSESTVQTQTLFQAVGAGSLQEVKRLLDNGADANAKDQYGRSALMLAAEAGKGALLSKINPI